MPIFDIACDQCGFSGEVIVLNADDSLTCPNCRSTQPRKLMSPTSSLTGRDTQPLPGPGDTRCCGQHPAQASCAGPGSCCGKMP
ncbi:MAG: zinc ribbon domain-containing protein [Desulfatitalea sp.]|nr:zinc ribbon domain-containing protein [Desulfatitalea sp.]NNK01646.1 zinc ribbon domain-containing protein [Desulfatitalea sp.]